LKECKHHTFFPESVLNNSAIVIVIFNLMLFSVLTEYILDMVDTVLGAEEVQELVMIYKKCSSWLEELHLQDYIDQVTKLFERSLICLFRMLH
jgi:hypothetical protein